MNSRESGHRIARQVTSWVGVASAAGALVVGAAVSAPAATGNTSSGNTSSGDTGESTTPNYGSRHHYSSTSPVQPVGPGSTAPQGRTSGS
ncbi:hypothetical protein [Arthrobacter sp. MA-N2]|uniref:hypothetical protein n=1 Tax=Arthrobacter sp. MA-N2 TaxID=1101188 RepID=UPI0012DF887D|nr:hypothetical protein [Arthrobacter sp. MA-N2]